MSTSTGAGSATTRLWVPWAGLVARLVLGGVFLYAGLLKVGNPKDAGAAVQAYRLLPPDLARTIGYALPTIEIGLALLLIVGLFTRYAAAAIGVLLVAFIVGIVSVWVRGYNIDCGCFGSGGDVTGGDRHWRYATEIVRDLGMLALAVFLVYRPRTRWALDSLLHHEPRVDLAALEAAAAGADDDSDDELDDLDDLDPGKDSTSTDDARRG
jgi:uncharacterized membrane protein YphA (DoxX/SURF4 family)